MVFVQVQLENVSKWLAKISYNYWLQSELSFCHQCRVEIAKKFDYRRSVSLALNMESHTMSFMFHMYHIVVKTLKRDHSR